MFLIRDSNNRKNISLKQIMDVIYLCILSLYIMRELFDITMFELPWPTWYYKYLRIAMIIYLIAKIAVYDLKKVKSLLFDILYLIIFYFIYKGTGYKFLLELGFFVLAAKEIPYQKILKCYFFVGTTIMAITILGALTGCIEDLVYYKNNMFKHAFGIAYTTDFGAQIIFLVMAYLALKKKEPTILINGFVLLLAYFLYKYSGTRTSSGCMVLLVIGGLYVKYSERIILKKDIISKWSRMKIRMIHIFDYFLVIMVPVCAILALIVTIQYSSDSNVMNKLNYIFSYRLGLGKEAIDKYGFSLWGSPFKMIGIGGNLVSRLDYNFVDSSYVMIFIRYGAILFLLTIIGFLFLAIRAKKDGKRYMLVLLSIMALQSVMEHHLLDIFCNPFVLLIFSDINCMDSKLDKNRNIVKYSVTFAVALVFLVFYSRILAYGRTIVTLLKLNEPERNIYFIMAFIAIGIICTFIIIMLCNLYQAVIKRKNKNLIFTYSIISVFCIILFIYSWVSGRTIMSRGTVEYEEAIQTSKKIIEKTNQIDDLKLYIDDIPYLYMNDKEIVRDIIPGIPFRKNINNVVIITDSSNEMTYLINAGYMCGQISEKEYLYTNDDDMVDILRESGIKMDDFYAAKQSVDLQKMAKQNKLAVDDNGSLIIEGSKKSISKGPRVTIYAGTIKVDYELELIDTDVSAGEVARLSLTSYNGANTLKEVIVNKDNFDENGHCIVSLESYISDSEGVEFLLLANDNTKLKLNSLIYGKIGKSQ